MQKDIKQTIYIVAAIFAVILAVGIFIGMEKAEKYLELKAKNDCAQASRHQVTIESDNVVVWYPIADVYKQCLDEKGY